MKKHLSDSHRRHSRQSVQSQTGRGLVRVCPTEARAATWPTGRSSGNDWRSRPPQRPLLGNRRGLDGLSVRETRGRRSAEENSA